MPLRQPLLLLPGMMCDRRLFGPQIDRLSDACDIRVGDIGRQDTMERIGAALLEEAPWKRFSLCGLSMGGIVAMEMVRQAPERIERLALLDTNHLADPSERRPVRDRQIAAARAGRMQAVVVEEMKPNYLAQRSRGNAALLDLLAEMAESLGAEVFVNQSRALRDRRAYADALAAFAGPVLVLCGAEDRLCPPERHRQMAALAADVRLAIVPGAGHIVTLEQPEMVGIHLEAWLAQAPRADREGG